METSVPQRFSGIGLLAAVVFALSACSDSSTAPGNSPSLTIKGSSSMPPALALSTPHRLSFSSADPQVGGLTGDPSSISLGMYALYVSHYGDCSD